MTATVMQGSNGTRQRVADDEEQAEYGRKVGERLRAIRRQKRLSLQDVERASDHEFKASVLGAYERGERSLSVPRLQRLAEFYEVPVEQLLPGGLALPTTRRADESSHISIDLRRAQALVGPEGEMLKRYLAAIQVKRQDFNGRVLTIRADDLQALACLFGVPVERVHQRMTELRLIVSG